jgi:hypothetical protein
MLLVEAALVAGWGVDGGGGLRQLAPPALNREAVAMVMRFDLMAREHPEDFGSSPIADRRSAVITLLFHAIRLAETLAAVALFARRSLVLAVRGRCRADWPRRRDRRHAFFTLIWAGFIIGGNYFHYYYCHQWGQSNHFMFMYWGFFVLLVLMI